MRAENQQVKAIERNLLHREKWNHRISGLLWILFAILVFFEALIAVLYGMGVTLEAGFTTQYYIVHYFLKPCITILVTVFVAQMISNRLLKRISPGLQSGFLLFTLTLMISQVSAFHYGISVIYALYVVPIVLSVIYVDRKTLFLTYALCVAAYLLTFFGYIKTYISPELYHHNYMAVLGNLAIMTAVYAISGMLLARVRELINAAVEQSVGRLALSHEIQLDSLTQLYNHATFYERLDESILRYRNNGVGFSIIVMDIDNFKSVNDTYGHDVGDVVILALVDVIRRHLDPRDLAFRYGGEEFAVITLRTVDVAEYADKMRRAFARTVYSEFSRKVTVSMGVCTYETAYYGRREFFSAADKALYRAKKTGKNRVCIARPDDYHTEGISNPAVNEMEAGPAQGPVVRNE